MIRRTIVWGLMLGGLLSSGGISIVEAGEPVFTKATDIYAMAEKAVQAVDKSSRIIRAEYHWGRADLSFRTGEFVFNVPRLKNEGGKRSSMRISIRDGKMKSMNQELQHWVDFDPPDPDPTKAFAAAGAAGLGDWLSKNKTAGLSMELIFWSKSMRFDRGNSPWVWRVRGWGPDVPGEYELYLDAGNMKILGGKSASKKNGGGKAGEAKKPKADDDGKAGESKKPTPDDNGQADEPKKPGASKKEPADTEEAKPSDDGKPDEAKKPQSDNGTKTDDTKKPKPDDDGKAGKSQESDSGKEKQSDKLGIKGSEKLVPKLGLGDLRKK